MKNNHFRVGWYVIYTKSNYEKKLYNELKKEFDAFLPLKKLLSSGVIEKNRRRTFI